jgi:hypothetical protein
LAPPPGAGKRLVMPSMEMNFSAAMVVVLMVAVVMALTPGT